MEQGVGARSDAAFVDALQHHHARLQSLARLLTGDQRSAEDLVAEAVARSLPVWRRGDVTDLGAYLRRVVVNLATRRWRRRRLGIERDHRAVEWAPAAHPADERLAERDRTLRAVAMLPPRRRAVVVLRFYEDLTEQQIADVLSIGIGTVKSQLSRALEQLREGLGGLEEA